MNGETDGFQGLDSLRKPSIHSLKKKPSKQEPGGSCNVMFPTEGRTERRIRLSVPLEVSKLQNPNDAETTVTENISSIGARVLSWRPT
jgi:hypothetical protein